MPYLRPHRSSFHIFFHLSIFFIVLSLIGPGTVITNCISAETPVSPVKTPRNEPSHVTTTVSGQVDMCLSCHDEKPDKAHGRDVIGCFICHRGNPLAGNMKRAHRGMIRNPGDFDVVEKTCGISGCHPDEVSRTKKSLMATNRGIISTLRYYWGEAPHRNEDITIEKIKSLQLDSPAIDYFRKLCGTCHTGMHKGEFGGFLADKGGGCTACHANAPSGKDARKSVYHIRMIKAVPSENCIRCHNRSGRIGLTYEGKYESEGYGTPYEEGELSSYQLQDGRFYQKLPADIHFEKAGMSCADCHTQKEIMGDGISHAHLEEQLEVECTTCHTEADKLSQAAKIARLPYSSWKHQINQKLVPRLHIKEENGRYLLKRLADNRTFKLAPPSKENCVQPVHKRISCVACHSTWVPQCYGCHVQYSKADRQLDKLAGIETRGKWTEFKSFVRFSAPPLGVEARKEYGPVKKNEKTTERIVVLVPG